MLAVTSLQALAFSPALVIDHGSVLLWCHLACSSFNPTFYCNSSSVILPKQNLKSFNKIYLFPYKYCGQDLSWSFLIPDRHLASLHSPATIPWVRHALSCLPILAQDIPISLVRTVLPPPLCPVNPTFLYFSTQTKSQRSPFWTPLAEGPPLLSSLSALWPSLQPPPPCIDTSGFIFVSPTETLLGAYLSIFITIPGP